MEKGENTDFKVAKLEKPAKPQQTRRQRRQKRSQAFRTNTNAKVIDARNKTRNERLCQRSRLYPYPFLPGVVGFNSGAIRVYRKIRSVLEQQLKLFDECTLYRYTLCQLLYALSKPLPYLSNTLVQVKNPGDYYQMQVVEKIFGDNPRNFGILAARSSTLCESKSPYYITILNLRGIVINLANPATPLEVRTMF
nr:unnamed protein product [Callosobruchus chinensis]